MLALITQLVGVEQPGDRVVGSSVVQLIPNCIVMRAGSAVQAACFLSSPSHLERGFSGHQEGWACTKKSGMAAACS